MYRQITRKSFSRLCMDFEFTAKWFSFRTMTQQKSLHKTVDSRTSSAAYRTIYNFNINHTWMLCNSDGRVTAIRLPWKHLCCWTAVSLNNCTLLDKAGSNVFVKLAIFTFDELVISVLFSIKNTFLNQKKTSKMYRIIGRELRWLHNKLEV